MQYLYLIGLFTALVGLILVDYRWRLALFADRRATLLTVLIGVVFFSLWDIAGIALGIFYTGAPTYLSGLELGPEYPIEELVFLTLLSYNTLLAWRGGVKLCSRI